MHIYALCIVAVVAALWSLGSVIAVLGPTPAATTYLCVFVWTVALAYFAGPRFRRKRFAIGHIEFGLAKAYAAYAACALPVASLTASWLGSPWMITIVACVPSAALVLAE